MGNPEIKEVKEKISTFHGLSSVPLVLGAKTHFLCSALQNSIHSLYYIQSLELHDILSFAYDNHLSLWEAAELSFPELCFVASLYFFEDCSFPQPPLSGLYFDGSQSYFPQQFHHSFSQLF